MIKFIQVRDAKLSFDSREEYVLKLFHPNHGVFRVADVDSSKGMVYFYMNGNVCEIPALECIYNYTFKEYKQEPSEEKPDLIPSEKYDSFVNILVLITDLLKTARNSKDRDDVETFAGWAAYEASQLSIYINHCLNKGEKK